MKRVLVYIAACVAITIVFGALLTFLLPGADERRAILLSAALAIGVQSAAFALATYLPPQSFLIAWGAGALLRFFVLAVYALVVTMALALPQSAALLSLILFLFPMMLAEPVLLRR